MQSVHIPRTLLISRGAITQVGRVLNELHCSTTLVVSGSTSWAICGQSVSEQANSADHCLVLDSTIEEVEKVRHLIVKRHVDIICAVGGGKVIDTCKYAAYLENNVDLISIPTAPSHDGICSPVAVIKFQGGVSRSLKAKMPVGVICDIDVLRNAPENCLKSGIGDLLSNLSAIQDWELAYETRFEKEYNGLAALIARNAASSFFELSRSEDIRNESLVTNLVEGLVLSGSAMAVAGSSRPCSGAEHLFSHALDELYGGVATHGEQVAVGTVLAACLRNENWKDYREFFSTFDMAVDCKKLGVSEEQIVNALVYGPRTRPGRYTILDKVGINTTLAREVAKTTAVV